MGCNDAVNQLTEDGLIIMITIAKIYNYKKLRPSHLICYYIVWYNDILILIQHYGVWTDRFNNL